MKKGWIITLVAIAFFGGHIMLGTSSDSPSNTTAKIASTPKLSFASVQQAMQNGAKLYDVRTADEYKTSHFAGAVNWSLQDIEAGKLPEVAKDSKVYVYCRSGNRSGQATTLLNNAGYSNVTDLGGLTDVESIGGKLINN